MKINQKIRKDMFMLNDVMVEISIMLMVVRMTGSTSLQKYRLRTPSCMGGSHLVWCAHSGFWGVGFIPVNKCVYL